MTRKRGKRNHYADEYFATKRDKRHDKAGNVIVGTSRKEQQKIMARDRHRCGYCGARARHVDHIVPVWHGGKSEWSNLVAACEPCNLSKRASLDLVWMEKLWKHGSSVPKRTARIYLARGRVLVPQSVPSGEGGSAPH